MASCWADSGLPDWTTYRQLGYFLKLVAARKRTLATIGGSPWATSWMTCARVVTKQHELGLLFTRCWRLLVEKIWQPYSRICVVKDAGQIRVCDCDVSAISATEAAGRRRRNNWRRLSGLCVIINDHQNHRLLPLFCALLHRIAI